MTYRDAFEMVLIKHGFSEEEISARVELSERLYPGFGGREMKLVPGATIDQALESLENVIVKFLGMNEVERKEVEDWCLGEASKQSAKN